MNEIANAFFYFLGPLIVLGGAVVSVIQRRWKPLGTACLWGVAVMINWAIFWG